MKLRSVGPFALIASALAVLLPSNASAAPPTVPTVCQGATAARDIGNGDPCAVWTSRFDRTSAGNDVPLAITMSANGSRVYVTGWSETPAGDDYATIALDASDGTQVWEASYNGIANGDDRAHAIAVSHDGALVFVTGMSARTGTVPDYATVAYDASTGAQVWVARATGPINLIFHIPASIAVADDAVLVSGTSWPGTGAHNDYLTVAYDAVTGGERWATRYDGPAALEDQAWSMDVAPDASRAYVTGWSYADGTGFDAATVAYDIESGTRSWTSRFAGVGSGADLGVAVRVGSDGSRLYVAGQAWGGSTNYDSLVVALDANTGAQAWATTRDGAAHGADTSYAVGVSPDDSRVFVTGGASGSVATGLEYSTQALDASDGTTVWSSTHGGTCPLGLDVPRALAVSPDGSRVYVSGHSQGAPGCNFDALTISYDASSGAGIWTDRHYGSIYSYGTAIAVSAGGARIHVSAPSLGPDTTTDFATLAYPATPDVALP